MEPFVHTVTIYNRIKTSSVIRWQRTVLHVVYCKRYLKEVISGDTRTFVPVNRVTIPRRYNYRPPTSEDGIGFYSGSTSGLFTVNTGDIIVTREITDEIPDNDTGKTLRQKYGDEAWIVKTATDSTVTNYSGHRAMCGVAHYTAEDV